MQDCTTTSPASGEAQFLSDGPRMAGLTFSKFWVPFNDEGVISHHGWKVACGRNELALTALPALFWEDVNKESKFMEMSFLGAINMVMGCRPTCTPEVASQLVSWFDRGKNHERVRRDLAHEVPGGS